MQPPLTMKTICANFNFLSCLSPAQNGFDFHHAKPGFVMMYKWLPTNISANIPEYAHTMIGVGSIVVNDKQQILTITEKHSIIAGSWKLPGGYVEPSTFFAFKFRFFLE